METFPAQHIDPDTFKCPNHRTVDGGLPQLEKIVAKETQLRLGIENP